MAKSTLIVLLAWAMLLFASASMGQPTPDDLKKAKALFAVAENQFNAGHYDDAVRALEECYRLTKDPKYLYSIGMAAEHAYRSSRKEEDLRLAVDRLLQYLQEADDRMLSSRTRVDGKTHRERANEALDRLQPLLPTTATPEVVKPIEPRTGIMVSSVTPGALIELDGKISSKGYLSVDVEPGSHHIRVSAPGYEPVERDIPIDKGGLIGIDITLKQKPALITVDGPPGAELFVDGVSRGELPLSQPVEVAPGERALSVRKRGAESFVEWRTLANGEAYSITADLPATTQRFAAWTSIGAATAAAVVASVLTGIAVAKQEEARAMIAPLDEGESVHVSKIERFSDTVQERDRFRLGAGIVWGVAAVGLSTGILLFAFDEPGKDTPLKRTEEPATTVALLPAIGPELIGASISGNF